jgi:CheY-like chemotaxis protein
MAAGSVRVVVADDHEVVRCGLANLLDGTDVEIVAEASSGEAAVRLAMKHKPDVILLDIRMAPQLSRRLYHQEGLRARTSRLRDHLRLQLGHYQQPSISLVLTQKNFHKSKNSVHSVENCFSGLRYGRKSLSTLAFHNIFLELIMPSKPEKPSNVLK